jgi:hypothetical protein
MCAVMVFLFPTFATLLNKTVNSLIHITITELQILWYLNCETGEWSFRPQLLFKTAQKMSYILCL